MIKIEMNVVIIALIFLPSRHIFVIKSIYYTLEINFNIVFSLCYFKLKLPVYVVVHADFYFHRKKQIF